MKTSNKILIIFIGTLAMFYLAYAIEARFLGDEKKDMKHYVFPISNFKYLKLENIKGLELKNSENTKMKVGYYGDSTKTKLNISYKADTLIINRPTDAKVFYGYYALLVSHNIKSICVDNSWIDLKKHHADSLIAILRHDGEIRGIKDTNYKYRNIIGN
jgi:hypothetical protein